MRAFKCIPAIVFAVLSSLYSCSDSIEGDDSDEKEQQEESMRSKEERDKELRNFLNNIAQLDTLETLPVKYSDVDERLEREIYRYDQNDNKYDYYHPKYVTTRIYGQEPVSELLASQPGDIIWPGNIIQGKSVIDGNLAPIPLGLGRKPGRIYLNAVSGQNMRYDRDIYTFTGSEVTQAMNDIMAEHTNGLPADVSFVQSTIHNETEMAYHLDMNQEEFKSLTGGAFSYIPWKEKKTRIMVKLVQEYFEMAYEFNGLHEVFKDDVRPEELQLYVGTKNPMCYISSVSYGRYFILLYESNESYEKLSQAINKTFNTDVNDTLTPEDLNIMRSASVTLRQIGGDADAGLATISGNAEKIREFVINGATANKDNVGAPIFYSIRYLGSSFPIRTYKKIDSEIERMEYVRAKKKNDVVIEIKDIRSNAVYITGGNFKKLTSANVTLGNIKVEVTDGNRTVKTLSFNPKIQDAGNKSTYHKSCNYMLYLGELGENTTKRVKIHFPITYYTKRKNSMGTDSKKEIRTFNVVAVYRFNSRTEKWEKDSNDMSGTTVSMNSMNLYTNFNYCAIGFRLNYSFSANKETF